MSIYIMTDNDKLFVRPKVRFNQTADSKHSERNTQSHDSAIVTKPNGPKIKSIVPIKQPIRIVKGDNLPLTNQRLKSMTDMEKTKSVLSLTQSDNNSDSGLFSRLQTSSLSNDECLQTEIQKPLNNTIGVDNIAVIQEPSGTNESHKILPENNNRHIKSSSAIFSEKPLHRISEFRDKSKPPLSKNCTIRKQQLEKENQEMNVQKKIQKQGLTKESNKTESSKSIINTKFHSTPKVTKDSKSKTTHAASKTKDSKVKSSGRVSAVIDVMPCLKYARANTKNQNVPVKKTILRDVVGHNIKPYVGPGISRSTHSQFGMSLNAENVYGESSTVPTGRFSRPEYNSIKCTIDKLNKVRREKIIADKEHLPSAYRHLMNRKITTALDFLPNEAIYKNLVDLSIDEEQLPARLIRSKDPEPRHRDIVPKLSDFFRPEPTEEYCTPVLVKSRNFEIQESWSAFRISDKIFEWKHKIDHDE